MTRRVLLVTLALHLASLVVNLRIAKALRLTIPQSILLRADEITR